MTSDCGNTVEAYPIGDLRPTDMRAVARLYGQAIPNEITSQLGERFGAVFIAGLADAPQTRIWVARRPDGSVAGFIAGTLSRSAAYRHLLRTRWMRLALAAAPGLIQPPLWRWLGRALAGRRQARRSDPSAAAPRPRPQLLAIAVAPATRGSGLARRLVAVLEDQFDRWNVCGDYIIRTEADNAPAQAFYRKLGARLIEESQRGSYRMCTYAVKLPRADAAGRTTGGG